MMVVAVARLAFSLAAVSLKDKRRVARALIDRTRRRFPVAVAEIEENDNHAALVLGCSVVSNDANHAISMLDHVVSFMEHTYLAPLILREREILHFGPLAEGFWDPADPGPESWEDVAASCEPVDRD
jgi:uncharacterized protein